MTTEEVTPATNGTTEPDTTDYKAKANEFRDSNRELRKKLSEYETRFKDVDLDEYQRLKTGANQVKSAEVAETERRYQKLLEEERSVRANLESTLNRTTLEGALAKQAQSLGVRPEALEDFLARGERTFKVVNGKVISAQEEGLSVEEWAKGLKKGAPHLFAASTGGGAQGSRGGSGGRMTLTSKQAQNPTPAQLEALAKGEAEVVD